MDINMRRLFESIADNDMKRSRDYAKVILLNNNKKCDESIKKSILPRLDVKTIELPGSIKGLVEQEFVDDYFKNNRFITTKNDEEIVKKVVDIWNARDKLSEYNIRYLNTLMLYGVPGCGKTMLGKYIAYKLNLPFMYLNFSNLISSYLGKTGENLQKVFDYIKTNRCVLMLDEIDAIGLERGQTKEVGEMSRIVINLMQCLDRADMNNIIIAATNRPDMIDKALKRRFSLQYEIGLPSEEVKVEIVKSYLDSVPSKYTEDEIKDFVKDKSSCADVTNSIINIIVKCITENKEITLIM